MREEKVDAKWSERERQGEGGVLYWWWCVRLCGFMNGDGSQCCGAYECKLSW
jgi:hypothetical protein